ncbi:hypothetical protein G7054_g13531 [Neopestalotiopsis clavispora]|nr:hypothetical protein G7054_g13531 [Neopestalotiopsis clavispora]
MTEKRNNLNVYRGPEALRDYFNPDVAPPLPLVELPDVLNPYKKDGVRIYAKMMTMHPANNVKAMPALNLLQNQMDCDKTKTVVEYSSGSTVISMSLMSKVLPGYGEVHAYLSNKTSAAKVKLMQFFGLNTTLFGGPSQPEPLDERGGISAARRWAQQDDAVINPNQYENDDNWKAHVRWTGPQIHEQLPEINVICAGMGTSGTMSGLGTYFKEKKPSVFRLGVCTAAGDRVPGPRSLALLGPVEFPWKSAVDQVEEVGSHDSYYLSLQLCRHGVVSGPSSGFNLKGLYQLIDKRKAAGTLSDLAGEDGQIHCVSLCCDLPYQYMDEYFDKLGPEHFPTVKNAELSNVDLFRYDEAWEREALPVLDDFYQLDKTIAKDVLLLVSKKCHQDRHGWEELVPPRPDTVVIDLRQPEDYKLFSLPGSINVPTVKAGCDRPFSDPSTLVSLWRDLMSKVHSDTSEMNMGIQGKRSLFICYNGDAARVATSVCRANGHSADSLRGGTEALHRLTV